MKEAGEVISASVDEDRNLNCHKALEDRVAVGVLHIYGRQAAMYNDLVVQESKKNR